jgi:serine/threonine-protein kinase
MIHRDIKPDNIIIRDADQKPILIDFGAVKDCLMCGQAATSIVIGSPGFIAPEQAAGRPGYASDIYSLGMTAIYLLTGKSPQELQSHFQSYDLNWQDYAPATSSTLATVINKAVQLNPGDRYPTATMMLQALQESSASTPMLNSAGLPPAPTPNTAGLPPTQYSRFNPAPAALTHDPATVAVSPSARSADHFSANTSTKPQIPAWLLGGLIAGGVVAAGLVGAYFYRQQNQPAILQTAAQKPVPAAPQPTLSDSLPSGNDATAVSEGEAISLLENLYSNLSNKDYTAANALFSPQMAGTFDPNFYNQFDRVTVENLVIRSRTDSSLNFIGENTYIWPDGSTQQEQRSYTVRSIDGQLVVTASEFIKVLKFR